MDFVDLEKCHRISTKIWLQKSASIQPILFILVPSLFHILVLSSLYIVVHPGYRVPQLPYISWLAGASRAFYSYTCAGLWPSCIFFFHRDIVSVVSPGSLLFFCMLLSLPASFRRRLPISSVLEDDSDSPPPPRFCNICETLRVRLIRRGSWRRRRA